MTEPRHHPDDASAEAGTVAERLARTDLRLASIEAAYLELLGRVQQLEYSLRFEVDKRSSMEAAVLTLCRLPGRIDRLEFQARACRRGRLPAGEQS